MYRSTVINNAVNCRWNEEFNLDIVTGEEIVYLEVWDKDDIGSDDYIGKCEFNIK